MSNAFIIGQRAAKIEDLSVTFARIDAARWRWAAERMAALGSESGAERAREFSREHDMLADRLSGAVAVGAGEDAQQVPA